jgi:MFS family permease
VRALRAFESLREVSFRFFLANRLFDGAAMSMHQMSNSLLIYRLTGSPVLLGLLPLTHAIPYLVLSPFAGVIADRLQKKQVVLLGEISSMVFAFGVAFSLTCGYLSADNAGSWWVLMVSSGLNGAVTSIVGPSRLSMIPDMVSQRRVTNAIALTRMMQTLAMIMGPALAGVIIDNVSFEMAYYTRVVFYFLSAILWLFVPLTGKSTAEHGNVFSDIKSVLVYIRQERLLLIILGFVMCLTFCAMPYRSLLPMFTEDILKVDATQLGLLQSVSGIGAIAGSLVIASMPNKRRGMILAVSSTILGLALTAFAFSESWYLTLGLVVMVGIGQTGQMILPIALIQNYTKEEYRGRVVSFYGMELGVSSFGASIAGFLAAKMGPQWAVGGLAIIMVVISLSALAFAPSLRKVD